MKTVTYLGDGVTFEYTVINNHLSVVFRTGTGASIYMGAEALEMLKRALEKVGAEHQDNTRLSD